VSVATLKLFNGPTNSRWLSVLTVGAQSEGHLQGLLVLLSQTQIRCAVLRKPWVMASMPVCLTPVLVANLTLKA
jgi:hypothetical protein